MMMKKIGNNPIESTQDNTELTNDSTKAWNI